MQALSVELEDETVAALEAERELFGFESRQEYVRWIIDHRGSIEADARDHDRTQDRLVADHNERLARLEERVATISRALERSADGGTRLTEEAESDGDATRTDGPTTASAAASRDSRDDHRSARDERADSDDSSRPSREPVLEVRGSPRTVRRGPDSRGRSDDANSSPSRRRGRERPERDGDGDSSSETGATSDSVAGESATLSPERVARIPEDPVHEDAGVLGNVESERLDELSRRAVATTRKRLNRDVQTGLEYTSSTRLAGDGVRPGEDITDLDALSIPGRSTETLEKRRHAVGRALAYLRDEGRARRSDFVDALYEECPAGYDTTDGWWRCIKEGLKQVGAVEGGEGTRVWRYRG